MNDNSQQIATPARHAERIILIVAAFALPTLSLIPMGGMYLWDRGWMLWWAAGSLVAVALATLLQRVLLRKATVEAPAKVATGTTSEFATMAERMAWSDVRAIASGVDTGTLGDADAVLKLGQRTIDAVARRLHPGRHDAVWQFTLPQALAISERVSARLGGFVERTIPFGDRLTVAQLLNIYGWRRYIGVAEQAYDVWRVIRMANPATAMTQEARERLSSALVTWGKEHVSRRIAEAYVEEVGRAAIDLYAGRLKTGSEREHAAEAHAVGDAVDTRASGKAVAPLSVLVVGAGLAREALRHDLGAAFEARSRSEPQFVGAMIGTTTAIEARGFARRQLWRAVTAADVVVWAVSAPDGVSAGDAAAFAGLSRYFASVDAPSPPGLVVAVIGTEAGIGGGGGIALGEGVAWGDLADDLGRAGGRRKPELMRHIVIARVGPTDEADLAKLVQSIDAAATTARDVRSRSSRQRGTRRSVWSNIGKAAAAAGGLAGAIVKPRRGGRDR